MKHYVARIEGHETTSIYLSVSEQGLIEYIGSGEPGLRSPIYGNVGCDERHIADGIKLFDPAKYLYLQEIPTIDTTVSEAAVDLDMELKAKQGLSLLINHSYHLQSDNEKLNIDRMTYIEFMRLYYAQGYLETLPAKRRIIKEALDNQYNSDGKRITFSGEFRVSEFQPICHIFSDYKLPSFKFGDVFTVKISLIDPRDLFMELKLSKEFCEMMAPKGILLYGVPINMNWGYPSEDGFLARKYPTPINPENFCLDVCQETYGVLSPHLTPPPLSFYHSPDNEPSDP